MRAPHVVIPLLLLLAAPAYAQTAQQEPSSIRVTGDATVTAKPDQAQIDVAVVTQADNSQRAVQDNADAASQVMSALKPRVGGQGKLDTIGYSLQPQFRYPRGGGEPEIVGYTVTNTVRATVNDLSRIGGVIDAASKAGANRVQQVRFMLQRDDEPRAQALKEAATTARAKADTLASALGVRIVRVLSVVEESTPSRPIMDTFKMAAAAPQAAPTPVEAGTIDVRANVVLTVEVAPR